MLGPKPSSGLDGACQEAGRSSHWARMLGSLWIDSPLLLPTCQDPLFSLRLMVDLLMVLVLHSPVILFTAM